MAGSGTVTINSAEVGEPIRLQFGGHVTIAQVRELHQHALDLVASKRDVTICCEGADYLDTAVVQVLIGLGRELEMQNNVCELTGIHGRVRRDFERIGLGHLIADHATTG
jgi:anti-anti-sigma factor